MKCDYCLHTLVETGMLECAGKNTCAKCLTHIVKNAYLILGR